MTRWVVLCLVFVLATGAHAADVAPQQQAPILARVLAYDRNLVNRSGESVMLAVVHNPSDPASVQQGAQMLAAFKQMEKRPLKGRPFVALALPMTALADARTRGIDAIYVCKGMNDQLGAIIAAARQQKLITLSASEDYARLGVSVGLAIEGEKPKLVINPAAAKEEGTQFGSDLLQLALLIR